MVALVLRRIVRAAITVVLASIMAFLLVLLLPGDPATIIAGDTATPEQIRTIRHEMGLDDPLVTQYGNFFGSLVTGDLGESIKYAPGTPVTTLIRKALPTTASLGLVTIAWSLMVAVPLGYWAARHAGSLLDRGIVVSAQVIAGTPQYVSALVLILVFAVQRQWFPALGFTPISEGVTDWLRSIALPSLALGLLATTAMLRVTRASFVEVLNQDYTRLTTAKGMTRRSIIWKHSLRNASTPIITLAGLQMSALIGATLVVEGIFVMPGIGSLALEAVNGRDIVLMQGLVVFTTVVVVAINLFIDLLNLYASPKSRIGVT